MPTYAFKPDASFLGVPGLEKADPQVIGEALARLEDKNGLDVRRVPDAARSPSHPLHRFFEWNNRKAADQYRLQQARSIIRAVFVLPEKSNQQPRPAYYSIQDDTGRSYRTLAMVEASFDFQAGLLREAKSDLQSFQVRYRRFESICEIVAMAIRKIEGDIVGGDK